jgi:predicted metal-dependent phosphoesterase TrpH
MHNRREFLKSIALLGAAATLPVHSLLAQDVKLPKPMGDGLSTIGYGSELNWTKTPRKISIPDVGEYKVLKGDFHIHTLFSDGQVMPRDRVLEAVDNGLDVISITDHIEYRPNFGGGHLKLAENNDDHNRSYDLAKGEAEKHNLILVRGTEITKSARHFNALFLQDVNPLAAVVNDWRAMIAAAVEQGGFIHWNHPSWVNTNPDETDGLKRGDPMRFFDEHEELRQKGHLHGVEVFNGTSFYPIALDWCNERNLAPITNSDIHSSEWHAYGHHNPLRPMNLILAKERSHDSIREAFFAGRVVGWAANMILGREPWVSQLFRSCVEIKKSVSSVTLRNRSDIPCIFEAAGSTFDLLSQGSVEISLQNKLTVCNWFVGMNKPLEIVL